MAIVGRKAAEDMLDGIKEELKKTEGKLSALRGYL
jgi:hypothetical protein